VIGVRVDRLTIRFGAFTAVDDVSFDVAPGEFVTLLGPSGCGKTTLLRMLSGFLTPTSGRIHLADVDVTEVPPEARDTALCFQSYALFPHLTVRQNVEFGLIQKRIPRRERQERIGIVASTLDLEPQLTKLPNQLSGGQQQRVSLGRALVMRPGVILFDEPLSNLDAKLRDRVRVEIRRIQRDYGLTAIYVTHDQAEALALSDRILVMDGGRIEQCDTPEALYHRPRSRFVADCIGSANVIAGEVEGRSDAGTWRARTPIGPIDFASEGTPPRSVPLCWRPEHVRLGEGELEGVVIDRSFQGNYTDLTVRSGDVEHRIQTSATALAEGDRARFAIAPEQVVVLEDDA